MVCSLGSGRMAVIARLLAAGRLSQTMAEEIGHQKSAAEYVCRELREADEANLLDEEDMHVYGSKPMSDPLQLVRFAACFHSLICAMELSSSELCRSLKYTEQTILELDGSTGNRKPPRKEKKKLPTSCANQATAVGERGRSEAMDSIDAAVPHALVNGHVRLSSFSNEAKEYSTCVDAASMMDGTGINLGITDHPASVMQPPTKRHKLIAGAHLPLPESLATESGVTKTASFAKKITCKGMFVSVLIASDMNCYVPSLVLHTTCVLIELDFPAPLATKMYYSQRNNRLRAALRHLYFQESSNELCIDVASPKLSNEMIASQDSCQRNPSTEQKDNSHMPNLSSAQSPSHILAKSPDICSRKAEGLPAGSLSNQFLVNNVSRPAVTPLGLTRSNFLPKPYSFASSTGNPLGTIQQPKGSVPVI
ncbi:uncharacterized protein G2W53_034668 [Senna tora]|uniref:Uncharacterized protein n=1 Tax=Senna tora TaxID=362788 RepID=A0A834T4K9_9FABA|nr:uncharacterized protein G2W53_034668 [Senna tora]